MKHAIRYTPFLAAICFLWAVGISLTFAVPNQISYQGLLTNGSGQPVTDSTYSVLFALFQTRTGGSSFWSETASVQTSGGTFNHNLGSVAPFPMSTFEGLDSLFLQITIGGVALTPRTQLVCSPFAVQSGGLTVRNPIGKVVIKTAANQSALIINQPDGDTAIILNGSLNGDSAVILPNNSVSAPEIKDEPGITVYVNTDPVTLVTGAMVDIVTLEIAIPDDGYIILEGKGYIELKGTTGANKAMVQISEDEGGPTEFPYFTMAGLNGYVNTGSNYFPVYVTRPYFKAKGTYTFRMEGRAQNPSPAEAIAWDNVLTATYYPTAYDAVKSISTQPSPNSTRISIDASHPGSPDTRQIYYLRDLRELDTKRKSETAQPPK